MDSRYTKLRDLLGIVESIAVIVGVITAITVYVADTYYRRMAVVDNTIELIKMRHESAYQSELALVDDLYITYEVQDMLTKIEGPIDLSNRLRAISSVMASVSACLANHRCNKELASIFCDDAAKIGAVLGRFVEVERFVRLEDFRALPEREISSFARTWCR